ncbi:TetR/AcrR family transcriptional regulator [Paenibacillus nuruki]|uniref:TetR/AcrR family transcriptional regulator n=1 Tax=Paenibacillus nuruki TaxID=1886670 RepID=UPI001FE23825|nr:TetR family transcriptional regulator [Paenibacillus nuruki]
MPKEKRKVLIDAAFKEFSRASLADASIANIIKEACIPRGSFYQYFEDKADIFFYILEEYNKHNREKVLLLLKENDGDIFIAFNEFFKMMLERFQHHEYRYFAQNIFLNMSYKVEHRLALNVNEPAAKERTNEFIRSINRSRLNVADEKEVLHLTKIIVAITIQNFIRFFAKEVPLDEIIGYYELELDLLKRGLSIDK